MVVGMKLWRDTNTYSILKQIQNLGTKLIR